MGEEVAGLPEDPSVVATHGGRATGARLRTVEAGRDAAGADALGARSDAARVDAVEAEPIGAFLSRQRRLRGIGLDELARTTCIPLRSLERLEAGAFDGTPDGFARGFVRTVAVALGLDPDDAVSRMLPEARPGARPRTPPFAEPNPWLAVVLALLGIAAVAVLIVEGRSGPPDPGALQSQRIYRRDAVRELAREQGLMPPRGATEIAAPDADEAAP
ncbi:MAG TPA: helix-turn-helix domain-containing protein [Myxococcota bacterium]|nr:helix-turn-helix domain-containing protein [Myxococcota bacterium]